MNSWNGLWGWYTPLSLSPYSPVLFSAWFFLASSWLISQPMLSTQILNKTKDSKQVSFPDHHGIPPFIAKDHATHWNRRPPSDRVCPWEAPASERKCRPRRGGNPRSTAFFSRTEGADSDLLWSIYAPKMECFNHFNHLQMEVSSWESHRIQLIQSNDPKGIMDLGTSFTTSAMCKNMSQCCQVERKDVIFLAISESHVVHFWDLYSFPPISLTHPAHYGRISLTVRHRFAIP